MSPDIENIRPEVDIFADLARLASNPGYAHAIAAICFRDNVIPIKDEIDSADIVRQFSYERLLRTEISTLVGLMAKTSIDLRIPEPHKVQEMLDRTDQLMQELHQSMKEPAHNFFRQAITGKTLGNPLTEGVFLKEAIFYGGESAYLFQYRDLAVPKYSSDNEWLVANKGFTINDARAIVASIFDLQNEKLTITLKGLRNMPAQQWTMLPAFMFSTEEIVTKSGVSIDTVRAIIDAFILPNHEKNSGFQTVSDFNVTNALPLLPVRESIYVCFKGYTIAESLYESPFYWMLEDRSYIATADKHRGEFTEDYCAERLIDVFGRNRVLKNVSIYRGKDIVAEIDVLVLFADRAIIVQEKSKRLTIEARKGTDKQLRDDFKRSIQAAYDQGLSCAKFLSNSSMHLTADDGSPITVKAPLTEIYIFCVLCEHYPALSFQARQFLKIETTNTIKPPFVMDVFTLDVVAEMLNTPLHFLSYINRRVGYADRVMSSHELTILSYHLKKNLWIDPEYDMFQLHDDISADLDAALLSRREGLPGPHTPDGILTRTAKSSVGRLIKKIEYMEEAGSINLGFMLLTLNEETINQLSAGIDAICRKSMKDGKHHDVTIGVGGGETGITVHSNFETDKRAREKLAWHCEKRKYAQRAKTWYGLCLHPGGGAIRFGISFDFTWTQSDEMDKVVADLPKGGKNLNLKTHARSGSRKIGRNDPCPCGSGKKYKKCCLKRD